MANNFIGIKKDQFNIIYNKLSKYNNINYYRSGDIYAVDKDSINTVLYDENYTNLSEIFDIDKVIVEKDFFYYLKKTYPYLNLKEENNQYIVNPFQLERIREKLTINKSNYKYKDLFSNATITTLNIDGLDEKQIEEILNQHKEINILNIFNVNVDYLNISKNNNLASINFEKANIDILEIFSNPNLRFINGIDSINAAEIELYDNTDNLLINQIVPLIKKGVNVKPDIIYYPSIRNELKTNNINNLQFIEKAHYGGENKIKYFQYEIEDELYKKIKDRFSNYIKEEDSDELKFAIIYYWMTHNIIYDDLYYLLNTDGYEYSVNGFKSKIKGLPNGTIKPMKKNLAVCEGYTKLSQFILKCYGINTENTHCSNIDSNKPNHSILKIELHNNNHNSNYYYSEITWDAGYCQKNIDYLNHFLLNKNDIEKDHKLYSVNYDKANFATSYSKEKSNELINIAKKRVLSADFNKFKGEVKSNNSNINIDYIYKICNRSNSLNYLTPNQLEREYVILKKKILGYKEMNYITEEEYYKMLTIISKTIYNTYIPIANKKMEELGFKIIDHTINKEHKNNLIKVVNNYISRIDFNNCSSDIIKSELNRFRTAFDKFYESKKINTDEYNSLNELLDEKYKELTKNIKGL